MFPSNGICSFLYTSFVLIYCCFCSLDHLVLPWN
jgi:hypothetical protein